jgi:hypothetical protein
VFALSASARVALAGAMLVFPCALPAATNEEPGLPWEALQEALAAEGDPEEAADGSGLDAGELADDVLRDAAAFREHPADVNTAGFRDLLRVPFMDPGAALRIVAARGATGGFAATEDLVTLGCLTPDAYAAVRPYITVVAPDPAVVGNEPSAGAPGAGPGEPATAEADDALRWSLLTRCSLSTGASEPAYPGPGTFVRLRLSRGEALHLGLACERDPGEDSFTDHTAFHAEWQAVRSSLDLRIGLGDLSVSWAQGLAAGSSGIASSAGYPSRRDRLQGYDGAAEASARRGVFAAVARGSLTAQVVLARTRLDASLDESGLVASLRSSGWHRTEGERSGRDALEEQMVGARVVFAPRDGCRAGLTAMRFDYDPPFAEGDPERQRFRFSGSGLRLGGADALVSGERWQAGAEVAVTDGGGVAGVAAAKARLGSATAAFGVAHVARDYWSPLGGGAPGASGGTNGTGAWLSAEYRTGEGTKAWCEMAVSRRPWRSYLSELPDGRRRLSLGIERALGAMGRASVTVRETLRSTEGGEPARSVCESSRLLRADWRSTGDPGLSVSVIRATALVDSLAGAPRAAGGRAVLGSALVLALRMETSLGERTRLDVGVLGVSRQGDAAPIVQYEPRLSGEFGLVSLNASGARWYARLRSGLGFGVGITARVAGGPEHGRVEVGIGIEAGG